MKTPSLDPSFQTFQIYPDWWLGGCLAITMLSAAAEGCLIRLKCHQWRAVTLPMDPKQLHRLTKVSEREWKTIWPELAPMFPVTEDGTGRQNPELYALYVERLAFLESKRSAGKKGGRPKKQSVTEHEPEVEPHYQPHANRKQSTPKPYGFGTDNHTGKQSESPMSMSRSNTEPLSPPPDGGGALPAAPALRVLGQDAALSTPTDFGERLDAAVASLEHDALRIAVRRFFDEQRIPVDRWASWVARFSGWMQGLGTSGGRSVDADGIALGLMELLDVNTPGRAITPQTALTFAERADARRARAPIAERYAVAGRSTGKTQDEFAIEQARAGDADAIAYCETHALPFTTEAVA